MATSLNRVTILGNLGKEPDVRSFNNGGKVANLSVAVSESWKDKNTGEWREKTEWVKVAVFTEYLVNMLEKNARKGSKVYAEGKLQTRKYQDRDGKDAYSTEVVVQGFGGQVILLDPKQQGGQESGQDDYRRPGGSTDGRGQDLDDSEDLPF